MSDHPRDRPRPGRPRPAEGGGRSGRVGGPSGARDTGPGRAGPRADDPEEAALKLLRQRLAGVLRRLPNVERQVLELRMGLVDGVPAKPGQVADRLGLSIAEVRKIEARAFERIREVGPIKGLERFLSRPEPARPEPAPADASPSDPDEGFESGPEPGTTPPSPDPAGSGPT